jgi:hypothetical protein
MLKALVRGVDFEVLGNDGMAKSPSANDSVLKGFLRLMNIVEK